MAKVCIECGKNDNRFNFLCQQCYLETHPIVFQRPRLKIGICRYCSSPSIKPDIWYELQDDSEASKRKVINKAIIDLIDSKFKVKAIKNKKIEIPYLDDIIEAIAKEKDIVGIDFSINGEPDVFLPEILLTEHVNLFIKYKKCKSCQLISTGGAVKSKVQIRCIKKQIDIIDKILNDIYNPKQSINVSKIYPLEESKHKDGWDLSFKDKKGAEYVVNYFKQYYGATVIETKETASYDRTKNKARSRLVYSLRLPQYIEGDIVLIDMEPYQIIRIKSNHTIVYDFYSKCIITMENESFLKTNLKNIYSNEELADFTVISIDHHGNYFQLMSLQNYEIFEVKIDPLIEIKENMDVKATFWENTLILSRFDRQKKLLFAEDINL